MLLIARNALAAKDFSRQLKEGITQKTYLALVRGGMESFEAGRSGQIRVDLESDDGRVSLASKATESYKRKPTATDWEVLGSSVGTF